MAALAVMEASATFLGTLMMNGVYSATVNHGEPGIALAVASAAIVLCMILMIFARPPPDYYMLRSESEASYDDDDTMRKPLLNPLTGE